MAPTRIGSKSLARVHFCAHYWHLQLRGDQSLRTPPDAWLQKLIDAGIAFEDRVVSSLPDVTTARDADHTLKLMRSGVPVIHQAVLEHEGLIGRPDLLERREGPSHLGAHYYQPIDIKSHSRTELKDRLQLSAYALLLGHAQGVVPDHGGLILSTGARETVRLESTLELVHAALRTARSVETGERRTTPLHCSECDRCSWRRACDRERRELRLSTLIAGTGTGLARRLSQEGLDTIARVAALTPQSLAHWLEIPLDRATAVWEGAQAWKNEKPYVRARPRLPDPEQLVIHYDIETFSGCVYLHGAYLAQGSTRRSQQFAARHPSEEYEVLCDFVSFLEQHPDAVIYTWTEYENGELMRLSRKYLDLAERIEKQVSRLVDLKELTKRSLALPVTSYSIKEVAPVFGFHWRAEDASGANSEVWYENWLKEGDRSLWEKILAYNEDDVIAMDRILEGMRVLLAAEGVEGR